MQSSKGVGDVTACMQLQVQSSWEQCEKTWFRPNGEVGPVLLVSEISYDKSNIGKVGSARRDFSGSQRSPPLQRGLWSFSAILPCLRAVNVESYRAAPSIVVLRTWTSQELSPALVRSTKYLHSIHGRNRHSQFWQQNLFTGGNTEYAVVRIPYVHY